MFSVTTKQAYWKWVDEDVLRPKTFTLKEIQDTFILSRLGAVAGKRILEVGGGVSRIAEQLATGNEVWLIDGFDGHDGGPTHIPNLAGVKMVVGYMGQHLRELPDEYFDFVFSVSVIEHVVYADFADCFKDIARVLATGGETVHAVDMYLFDDPDETEDASRFQQRLQIYLDTPALAGQRLQWREPPEITTRLRASASFAFNSMPTLLAWNRIVPHLRDLRARALSCNAQMVLTKVE